MSINVWYNAKTKEYNVMYNGKRYTRSSYVMAKELIESFMANMVLVETSNAA